jgi:hypothetical protein
MGNKQKPDNYLLLPDASRRQQRAADASLVARREAPHNQRIQQTSAYGLAPDPQRVMCPSP